MQLQTCVNVNVIYLLSTVIKHHKAACTVNELDSKAAMLHLQLPTN